MSEELNKLKTDLTTLASTLKANHLKMAKALLDSKSQEEAYRISGGKAKDGYAAASEMLKLNPKISQYVELVKKIDAIEALPKQIATREQKRQMLWEVAQRSMQEVEPEYAGYGEDKELIGYTFNAKGVIGAIAELNKMDGDLAAIKTENRNYTVESLIDELTSGKSGQ